MRSCRPAACLCLLLLCAGACRPARTSAVLPTSAPTVLPTARNLPATPTSAYPGLTTASSDGMTLLRVPAGAFYMGNDRPTLKGAYAPDEAPRHNVYLDMYFIDQTEVTNRQFTAFIAATGYQTDAEREGSGLVYNLATLNWEVISAADWRHPRAQHVDVSPVLENDPVTQVSWNDALAYCQWAGRRLPSEAEWEKAAGGPQGNLFPWGNPDIGPEAVDPYAGLPIAAGRLNFNFQVQTTRPVGDYPAGASPYGALDMAGNVWEWVSDWFDPAYYAVSPPRDPHGPAQGIERGLRGGSWASIAEDVRSASRFHALPNLHSEDIGFRCAQSP